MIKEFTMKWMCLKTQILNTKFDDKVKFLRTKFSNLSEETKKFAKERKLSLGETIEVMYEETKLKG